MAFALAIAAAEPGDVLFRLHGRHRTVVPAERAVPLVRAAWTERSTSKVGIDDIRRVGVWDGLPGPGIGDVANSQDWLQK